MSAPSVGVVKSDFHGRHSTSWSNVWLDYCSEKGVNHELVDWRELDAFDRLAKHDIVLWHYSHYSRDEMLFARSILAALKASGCRIYPDFGDADHFDDKIAQSYLLKALGLGTPQNYPLHSEEAVEAWIVEFGEFPVVAKLRSGSGASNVQLIRDVHALRRYSAKMFSDGLNGQPSAAFKIRSNIASTRSWKEFKSRLRRAPEFLFSRRSAGARDREKGYVYLQEFIPGVDHDLKVVVVGDQLSYVCRAVRAGDFRASGGGTLFYDHTLIDRPIIDAAFEAARAMSSDCTGFDMITDPRNGHPLILEVSYGFSHTAQIGAGGHFDRSGTWHEAPLNAPWALLDHLVTEWWASKNTTG